MWDPPTVLEDISLHIFKCSITVQCYVIYIYIYSMIVYIIYFDVSFVKGIGMSYPN